MGLNLRALIFHHNNKKEGRHSAYRQTSFRVSQSHSRVSQSTHLYERNVVVDTTYSETTLKKPFQFVCLFSVWWQFSYSWVHPKEFRQWQVFEMSWGQPTLGRWGSGRPMENKRSWSVMRKTKWLGRGAGGPAFLDKKQGLVLTKTKSRFESVICDGAK